MTLDFRMRMLRAILIRKDSISLNTKILIYKPLLILIWMYGLQL